MKLYSGPLSLFTAKVRIALAEKQLDYERIEVDYSLQNAYLPHHPEVARLNPKGQVPVLIDDDLVVYDSTLILEYLEERHPEHPLLPAGREDRARCRQLEAYGDEILFPDLWSVIQEVLYNGINGTTDPKRLADARGNLAGHHVYFDRQLGSESYLVGDFSVADIGNFIFLNAAASLGAPFDPELSRLAGWFDRVRTRPTVRAETTAMQEFMLKLQAQVTA